MAKKKYDFRVVVDGIDLEPEVQEKLSNAVANAALQELAGIDKRGDFASLRFPGGQLDGRKFVSLGQNQIEQLGMAE